MKDYNLQIQIQSLWVIDKLNARNKYNSVLFVDYSPFVENIFTAFQTDVAFNRFRYQLYKACEEFVHIKRYHNWYRLESNTIYITPNLLASCLPREIRRRYFKRDSFYEKYLPKDFTHHYL